MYKTIICKIFKCYSEEILQNLDNFTRISNFNFNTDVQNELQKLLKISFPTILGWYNGMNIFFLSQFDFSNIFQMLCCSIHFMKIQNLKSEF